MSVNNYISEEHYNILCSLNENKVTFSDDEIFIYKLGVPPRDTIAFMVNGTVEKNIDKVICIKEGAESLISQLPVSFNILNMGKIALSLRFGWAQSITKKEISRQEAMEMIQQQIKYYVRGIQNIKEDPKIKGKEKQYLLAEWHKQYIDVTNSLNQMQFENDNVKIYKSNELHKTMYGYVYIDHINSSGKEINKKYHLSKNKPNIIIITSDYRSTFNKRTRNTSKLSNDKIISLEETSPFDIFINFGN